MANQELRVGDIVRDPALLRPGMRVQYLNGSVQRTLRTHDGEKWWNTAGTYVTDGFLANNGVTIIALPAPADGKPWGFPCITPACTLSAGHDGCHCSDRPAPPAPPPPRCAPGCSPARACYTPSVCPAFEERRLAGYNYGHGNDDTDVPKGVTSDIPPAREPRIGALSWSHATVCGGLSTRRGR